MPSWHSILNINKNTLTIIHDIHGRENSIKYKIHNITYLYATYPIWIPRRFLLYFNFHRWGVILRGFFPFSSLPLNSLEEISTQNGPPKENNKIIVKIINLIFINFGGKKKQTTFCVCIFDISPCVFTQISISRARWMQNQLLQPTSSPDRNLSKNTERYVENTNKKCSFFYDTYPQIYIKKLFKRWSFFEF